MRRLSIYSVALFSFVILPSCTKPKVTDDDRIRSILTKGHAEWGPPGINWGFAAVFAPEHETKWRYVGEGVNVIPMSYTITHGKIRIDIKPEALAVAHKHSVETLKASTTCTLTELNESLEYLYELQCDNKLRLYPADHPVIDQPRTVGKHAVVATGNYKAKVVDSVKFRREPESSAPTITCTFAGGNATADATRTSDTLPQGFSELRVLARTPEKMQVKNWNNYWLYVLVITDGHDGESCQANYGWLFGEFVKPFK